MSDTLSLPPFPPLEWDGYFWTGSITLPAWAGFQSRRGPYASLSSPAPSDGAATLDVRSPDDAGALPLPEQAAAFRHLVDGQEATRDAILRAVLDAYPERQVLYGYEFGCRWDDEHGLGAMTHAGRVVEVGGADTAILEWIATGDGGKTAESMP